MVYVWYEEEDIEIKVVMDQALQLANISRNLATQEVHVKVDSDGKMVELDHP